MTVKPTTYSFLVEVENDPVYGLKTKTAIKAAVREALKRMERPFKVKSIKAHGAIPGMFFDTRRYPGDS